MGMMLTIDDHIKDDPRNVRANGNVERIIHSINQLGSDFHTVNCRLKSQGIKLFDIFFWNPVFNNYREQPVKVTYQVKNFALVLVHLDSFTYPAFSMQIINDLHDRHKQEIAEAFSRAFAKFENCELKVWGENPVVSEITIKDDLTEAKAVINQMASALLDATMIRGIYAGLNDPLALQGEKQGLRNRYLQIEAKINAAIETSRKFLK